MTRCVEYYERCERDGCDWCEKEPETVRTIKEYIEFYKEMESLGIPKDSTIRGISETAARPLIRNPDKTVRERAISHIGNALNRKTPQGGQYTTTFTEREVKKIIEKVELEVRKELMAEMQEEPAAPTEVIEDPPLQESNTGFHRASEPEPTIEPAVMPQAIKDKRAKTEQIIEEMLSNMSLRFDGIIERFMSDLPNRFPTKESVIAEALDFFAENFHP